MTVTILEDGSANAPGPSGKTSPAASVMKIAGKDREVFTAKIGSKKIVYTEFLTVSERRQLSRAMLPNDVMAVEAYGFNQAAARVRMIDGAPIGFPGNDAAIEAILSEMGDEAAEWLFDQGNESLSERRKERVKNSLTTAGSDSP